MLIMLTAISCRTPLKIARSTVETRTVDISVISRQTYAPIMRTNKVNLSIACTTFARYRSNKKNRADSELYRSFLSFLHGLYLSVQSELNYH